MPDSPAPPLKISCPNALCGDNCPGSDFSNGFTEALPMPDSNEQVTKLLQAIDQGESGAAEKLLPLVYEELRSRAGKLLVSERRDHTLQRTALVHEAYLKLARGELSFQSRVHFFNAAALAMRRILVDH